MSRVSKTAGRGGPKGSGKGGGGHHPPAKAPKAPAAGESSHITSPPKMGKPKHFEMPAMSVILKKGPDKNAVEKEKAKQKMKRRNAPHGEDAKKLKEIVHSTRPDGENKAINVHEFVGLIAPSSGDDGEFMRFVLADELTSFRRLATKVYETMTQDVTDVLTNEHVQLEEVARERHTIYTEKMKRTIDEIYEYIPDFNFDRYYQDVDYLHDKMPLCVEEEKNIEEEEVMMRQEAYHRYQWLRSEGERLSEENGRLVARLTDLKKLQRSEMSAVRRREAENEKKREELIEEEQVLHEQVDELNKSIEKSLVAHEGILMEEMRHKPPTPGAVHVSPPRHSPSRRSPRTSPMWAAEAARQVEEHNTEIAVQGETSRASVSTAGTAEGGTMEEDGSMGRGVSDGGGGGSVTVVEETREVREESVAGSSVVSSTSVVTTESVASGGAVSGGSIGEGAKKKRKPGQMTAKQMRDKFKREMLAKRQAPPPDDEEGTFRYSPPRAPPPGSPRRMSPESFVSAASGGGSPGGGAGGVSMASAGAAPRRAKALTAREQREKIKREMQAQRQAAQDQEEDAFHYSPPKAPPPPPKTAPEDYVDFVDFNEGGPKRQRPPPGARAKGRPTQRDKIRQEMAAQRQAAQQQAEAEGGGFRFSPPPQREQSPQRGSGRGSMGSVTDEPPRVRAMTTKQMREKVKRDMMAEKAAARADAEASGYTTPPRELLKKFGVDESAGGKMPVIRTGKGKELSPFHFSPGASASSPTRASHPYGAYGGKGGAGGAPRPQRVAAPRGDRPPPPVAKRGQQRAPPPQQAASRPRTPPPQQGQQQQGGTPPAPKRTTHMETTTTVTEPLQRPAPPRRATGTQPRDSAGFW